MKTVIEFLYVIVVSMVGGFLVGIAVNDTQTPQPLLCPSMDGLKVANGTYRQDGSLTCEYILHTRGLAKTLRAIK